MDGKIDPNSMKNVSSISMQGSGTKAVVAGVVSSTINLGDIEVQTNNGGKKKKKTARKRRRKATIIAIAPPSSSIMGGTLAFRSSRMKKQRTQDLSAESLPALEKEKQELFIIGEKKVSQQPHVVVPDQLDGNKDVFDCSPHRFNSAEALVDHVVNQAIILGNTTTPADGVDSSSSSDSTVYHPLDTIKDESNNNNKPITSKRKVSDADELLLEDNHKQTDKKADFFTNGILSLVQSNIMVLQTCQPSGTSNLSKLSTSPPQPHGNTITVTDTRNDILTFLRHPKLQREQQQNKPNKSLFVLPRLLNVSIEDEYNLRARALEMTSSMLDNNSFIFPRNNKLNDNDDDNNGTATMSILPLRAFLGYKSSKSPSRQRLVEMLSDVLFDVSHALYAWLHTEDELARTQQQHSTCSKPHNRDANDMHIKALLFDDRALKRIGGFEPSSLLPLALGVHRCREGGVSWVRYAMSREGRVAMNVHTKQRTQPHVAAVGGGSNGKGEEKSTAATPQKRFIGTIMENEGLLELGRKRRGRRGKNMMSCR